MGEALVSQVDGQVREVSGKGRLDWEKFKSEEQLENNRRSGLGTGRPDALRMCVIPSCGQAKIAALHDGKSLQRNGPTSFNASMLNAA